MDSTLKNILLGAAAYTGYILYINKKDQGTANALKIQLKDIDIDWQRIRLMLNIQNPTNGNIIIRSIVGDIYINGSKVAILNTFGYNVVKSNGQLLLPVTAEIRLANAVQSLMQMMNQKQQMKIDVVGTINVNHDVIPLKMSFYYPNA